MNSSQMIKLTIDGKDIDVKKGTTIFEAAKLLDILIPTLCYNPELKPYGACRLCLVEVMNGGKQSLEASCVRPAENGMVVNTKSEQVMKARQFILELMLIEAPDSPVIKRFAHQYKITESRFKGLDDESRECILCGLCVRLCSEKEHKNVLAFSGRGSACRITTAFGRHFDDEYCTSCGRCVVLCPVEQK